MAQGTRIHHRPQARTGILWVGCRTGALAGELCPPDLWVMCFAGYQISWEVYGRNESRLARTLSNSTLEYKITGLSSLTTYTIEVAAVTAQGSGWVTSSTISSGVPPGWWSCRKQRKCAGSLCFCVPKVTGYFGSAVIKIILFVKHWNSLPCNLDLIFGTDWNVNVKIFAVWNFQEVEDV